jgi:Predicted membrane protein (DUF2079)
MRFKLVAAARALVAALAQGRVIASLFILEAVATICFYILPALREYRSYSLWNFDYGILFQSSSLIGRLQAPFLTTRGVHALADNQEYFQIAFSWLHHLPGPHYWLIIAHSLGIFASGVVVFFAARRQPPIQRLLLPVFCWFSPFLININLDLFHTEAFATVWILLAFLAAKAGRNVLFWVAVVLALLCKEDVAITVATFCFLAWWKHERFALPRRVFLWSAGAAVAVFVINLLVVLPHYKLLTCQWLNPAFGASNLDAAPVAPFFRNTFANFTKWDFFQEKLGRPLVGVYLLKLMWPVLLVAPKVGPFWLLPLPGAAINVIADTNYLVKGFYHYDHSTFAGVIVAVLLGLERMRRSSWIASALMAVTLLLPLRLTEWYRARPAQLLEKDFWRLPLDNRVVWVEELNRRLPADVIISADYISVSYLLPDRDNVFMFENPFRLEYFGIYGLCEQMATPPIPEVLVLRQDHKLTPTARKTIDDGYTKVSEQHAIQVFVNRASRRYSELTAIVLSL